MELSSLVHRSENMNNAIVSVAKKNSTAFDEKTLDYDKVFSYLRRAQSRTCLWVSADPRIGEEIGKVPGTNRSSRYSGQPGNARTS